MDTDLFSLLLSILGPSVAALVVVVAVVACHARLAGFGGWKSIVLMSGCAMILCASSLWAGLSLATLNVVLRAEESGLIVPPLWLPRWLVLSLAVGLIFGLVLIVHVLGVDIRQSTRMRRRRGGSV